MDAHRKKTLVSQSPEGAKQKGWRNIAPQYILPTNPISYKFHRIMKFVFKNKNKESSNVGKIHSRD